MTDANASLIPILFMSAFRETPYKARASENPTAIDFMNGNVSEEEGFAKEYRRGQSIHIEMTRVRKLRNFRAHFILKTPIPPLIRRGY